MNQGDVILPPAGKCTCVSAQGLGQISLGGWLFTKARGSRPTLGKQGWVLLVLFCFVLNVSSSDFEKKKKMEVAVGKA